MSSDYVNLLIQTIPTVPSDPPADFWGVRCVRWKFGFPRDYEEH